MSKNNRNNKGKNEQFEKNIARLDTHLFDKIPTQTSRDDQRSLLAIQRLVRNDKNSYVYLEIGSHLGGSIQPYLLDPRCKKIYSIDKRPEIQPDESRGSYAYPGNSTKKMLKNLERISNNLNKLECSDADASKVDKSLIELKPDTCFIDGEHTNKKVAADFAFCKSLMGGDGIVIFHDRDILKIGIDKIISELTATQQIFAVIELGSVICAIFLGESVKYYRYFSFKNPQNDSHLGGQVIGGDQGSFDPKVWTWFVDKLNIHSVLSIGCGQGYEMNYFKNVLGCEVLGIDGDPYVIQGNLLPNDVILHDYVEGPYIVKKEYDLVLSYEFVEHVEKKYKENFLKTFQCAKKYILMTHAVPGQAGWHHVNCQPDEYWIREIERLGFKYEPFITKFARAIGHGHLSKSGLVFSNKSNASLTKITLKNKALMCWLILWRIPFNKLHSTAKIVDREIGRVGLWLKKRDPRLYYALKKFARRINPRKMFLKKESK